MCLVSFIPTASGFILSSNRDESAERDTKEVKQEFISNEEVWFPADKKGGSWIFSSKSNRVICVLNGAFQNHTRQLPYRMSRGVMAKLIFSYEYAIDFIEVFDFSNIEPFTMIVVEKCIPLEFRWDGQKKYIERLDAKKIHVWSSCTLYDDKAIEKRSVLLRQGLQQCDLNDSAGIISTHLHRDETDLYNGLYMNRNGVVRTISHSQIIVDGIETKLSYRNLLDNQAIQIKIN